MKSTYIEGPSFAITLEDGLVTCRIWARPDLDWAEGARLSGVIAKALIELAEGPRVEAKGLLIDEREALPVVGPRTQAAIGALLSAWEGRGRRIGYVLDDSPVRGLQMRRLFAEWAPKQGRAFMSIEEARAWALGQDVNANPPSVKLRLR